MIATTHDVFTNDIFREALDFTLKWEGGYSNDPEDRGGRTNLGVTQTTLNEYRRRYREGPRDVKQLTHDEAQRIYQRLYWDLAGCDCMPKRLAIAHFDWSVNHGVGGAVKDLQECLGDLKVDGGFGPNTERRLREYLQAYGENALLQAYLTKRRYFYEHGQPKFRRGWLNRLNDLERYLNTLPKDAQAVTVSVIATPNELNFLDTYKYWDNLPHQVDAAQYLWEHTQPEIKTHFAEIWREAVFSSEARLNYTAKVDTTVKQRPVDSSQLPSEQIARIKKGTELTCLAQAKASNNHIQVTLEGASIKGEREWYLFAPHWEGQETLPENQGEISFVKKPQDRGRPITVPGEGTVYLNDPIRGTQHFYWYEATHNGQRIPQNATYTQNIIKIAQLAEDARAKLGQPLRITSWYRPEPWNSRAGGAKNSVHLRGGAIDFNAGTMKGREMARILRDWSGGMGIYSHYPMLLHLDIGPRRRW